MDMSIQVGTVDVVIFTSSVLISIMIGLYFANKNKTMSEYMLGDRNMGVLPVGVSMMTSFLSGVSIISCPYEVYAQGWSYALVGISCLLSGPISAFLILPVFYGCNYLSIYQYLEDRYSKSVRTMVSLMFMFQMLLYNAMVLYVPSLSLQAVTGIDIDYMIVGVGMACCIYATFGGIKSVIWTDLFQGTLMVISILVICIKGTLDAGGINKVWSVAKDGGRLELENSIFNFDFTTRHTVFNIFTGNLIQNVYLLSANQIQVQRAFSLSTLKKAKTAVLLSTPLSCIMIWMLCYTGMIVYYNYLYCDPVTNGDIAKNESILPFYVMQQLSYIPGLSGLFIAGIFSATLSTLSSFSNSLAAITIDDYINPMRKTSISDKTATKISKFLAFFYGSLCVILSFGVKHIKSLLQVALGLLGAMGAPFLAVFLLGMHTKFCNTAGVISGMAVSITFSLLFQVGQELYSSPLQTLPVSTIDCPNNDHLAIYNTSYNTLEMELIEATGCNRLNEGCQLISEIVRLEEQQMNYDKKQNELNIFDLSYMWLPVIAFVMTVLITILVSLLTGGRRQYVNEKCLFSSLSKTKGRQSNNIQSMFG